MIVPVVLASAIALGTYGFRYAGQLGEKSEQSLVESTQLLGKQTIERIDNSIVDSDRSLFELVDLGQSECADLLPVAEGQRGRPSSASSARCSWPRSCPTSSASSST